MIDRAGKGFDILFSTILEVKAKLEWLTITPPPQGAGTQLREGSPRAEGRPRPKVQTLTLSYTILKEKVPLSYSID